MKVLTCEIINTHGSTNIYESINMWNHGMKILNIRNQKHVKPTSKQNKRENDCSKTGLSCKGRQRCTVHFTKRQREQGKWGEKTQLAESMKTRQEWISEKNIHPIFQQHKTTNTKQLTNLTRTWHEASNIQNSYPLFEKSVCVCVYVIRALCMWLMCFWRCKG